MFPCLPFLWKWIFLGVSTLNNNVSHILQGYVGRTERNDGALCHQSFKETSYNGGRRCRVYNDRKDSFSSGSFASIPHFVTFVFSNSGEFLFFVRWCLRRFETTIQGIKPFHRSEKHMPQPLWYQYTFLFPFLTGKIILCDGIRKWWRSNVSNTEGKEV